MECQTILENNRETFTPNTVLLKEQKYKNHNLDISPTLLNRITMGTES